jgi:ribosomal protein L23|tara:strand:+ start:444 stop:593 length:150 start_codon:yes stop_codon:yes gene_type:complete
MAVSKRAKARFKIMSSAEKNAVKKAVKLLYDTELMGVKRMREIMRLAEK